MPGNAAFTSVSFSQGNRWPGPTATLLSKLSTVAKKSLLPTDSRPYHCAMKRLLLAIVLGPFALLSHPLFAQPKPSKAIIDWPAFLAQQDPVWEKMPLDYYTAPFVGNGLLGTLFFKDTTLPRTIGFEIGRTDVYDHPYDDAEKAKNLPRPRMRLPIGKLLLTTVGEIQSSRFRIGLWDAEITGTVTTDKGTLELQCLVPSGEPVIVVRFKPSPGEAGAGVSFRPEAGDNSRTVLRPDPKAKPYQKNPPFRVSTAAGAELIEQPLLCGDTYATAWDKQREADGTVSVYATVANNWAEKKRPYDGSRQTALAALRSARKKDFSALLSAHRRWWHGYYPASFVSLPDARAESFYWLQQYRLASAGRPGLPAIDLLGPWYKPTVWLAMWNNLNIQLAYYTTGPTNHLDMEEPVFRMLEEHSKELEGNVPPEFRNDCSGLGNPNIFNYLSVPIHLTNDSASKRKMNLIALPWLMQQFYLHYRFSMDEARLRSSIYPMMRRAFNVYLRTMYKGTDGKYHLPLTFSDEYGEDKDVNLNLALARWGFKTLLSVADRLKIEDTLVPKWKDALANLTAYPTDERGLKIGRDLSFNRPHRHYSHLFCIFPLYETNIEEAPEKTPLLSRSIANFTSLDGDNCMFKFNGAASLWAALGNGDSALKYFERSIEIVPKGPTVTPNGFYSENKWPTFESPLASVRSSLDMLLQSWGDKIRVFPAMPTAWKDAVYDGLRAEGAFLIGAKRTDGKTRFVKVESLAGEPCRIQVKDWAGQKIVPFPAGIALKDLGNGLYEAGLKKGQTVVLYPAGARPDLSIAPLQHPRGGWNGWGVK